MDRVPASALLDASLLVISISMPSISLEPVGPDEGLRRPFPLPKLGFGGNGGDVRASQNNAILKLKHRKIAKQVVNFCVAIFSCPKETGIFICLN
jgi:hypothetical protein